jgi:predicted lipoprotein with Yx(FWY)xxD motif
MIKHLVAAGMLFAALGMTIPAAYAASEPAKIADTSQGKAWVDMNGMTLYTFDKDTKTKSKCNDKCAVAWPPLAASATDKASGKWTIVKRDDGSLQWAYSGHPFYTFVEDKKPGDVTGDGKDGFHLAKAKMTASSKSNLGTSPKPKTPVKPKSTTY